MDEYTVILTVEGPLRDGEVDTREVERGRTEIRVVIPQADGALAAALLARHLMEPVLGERAIHAAVAMPSWDYRKRADDLPLPALLTVNQAAVVLGSGRQRVRQLIDDGQLPAVKIGRDWILREVDVEARRERRDRYEALYTPESEDEVAG